MTQEDAPTTFGTTIVDPPWPYERTSGDKRLAGYSDGHYEPLSTEDLAALPIGDVTSNVLLLWATAPMVREALQLIDAWGFEYVTQMYWLKASQAVEGTLFGDAEHTAYPWRPNYGVGYWVRGNVEPVFIAKKRGTSSYRTKERSCFVTRRGEHSEKPDTLHVFAETYLPGPYLEVFARRRREGWFGLGDGIDGRDIRESLAEVAA